MSTLTPAYGRDYTCKADVVDAYKNGSDFVLNDITSPWNGKYCSNRDFIGQEVKLRYNKLESACLTTYYGA